MAEPLRVLQLYPKEDYFTGAAIQLRELVLGLKARGHDVAVATRPSEIWVEKMRAASVPYLPLPMASEVDLRGHRQRSEEHTSELQSRLHLVCRLLLEKKKDTVARTTDLPPTT